ncbi:MAG: methyltransferase domain-containing protein [Candidatus Brocadiia bacterium]
MSEHHHFPSDEWKRLIRPERYEEENPQDTVSFFGLKPGSIVVDIGCGPGFYEEALIRAVGTTGRVIAVDRTEGMIEAFRASSPVANKCDLVVAEIPPLPLSDACADYVWLVNVLHEFDETTGALQELNRVLRDGGQVLCIDWAAVESGHGPPIHVRISLERAIAYFSETGFTVEDSGMRGTDRYFIVAQKHSQGRGV